MVWWYSWNRVGFGLTISMFRAEFGFIFCSSRNVLRISLEEIGKSGQNRVFISLFGFGSGFGQQGSGSGRVGLKNYGPIPNLVWWYCAPYREHWSGVPQKLTQCSPSVGNGFNPHDGTALSDHRRRKMYRLAPSSLFSNFPLRDPEPYFRCIRNNWVAAFEQNNSQSYASIKTQRLHKQNSKATNGGHSQVTGNN